MKKATTKKAAKRAPAKKKVPASARETVTERVVEMLRRGATNQEIRDATAWAPHSVRGFISGVARKKLGLDVQLVDGKYKVVAK